MHARDKQILGQDEFLARHARQQRGIVLKPQATGAGQRAKIVAINSSSDNRGRDEPPTGVKLASRRLFYIVWTPRTVAQLSRVERGIRHE